jgi:hypothetical protein
VLVKDPGRLDLCATVGCDAQAVACRTYDQLGRVCGFCGMHDHQLSGVRESITRVPAQIEGLSRILQTKVAVREEILPLVTKLQDTVLEQGNVLVQLIQRERMLTGADD